jgi:hypothetical protein
MKYSKFFFSMSRAQQDEYAKRADTTGDYLRIHVFAPIERRKIPRREKIELLVSATGGKCSLDDVLEYLYKSSEAKTAA